MSAPVTLRGRIAREPEMRTTNSGDTIAHFTVVTEDRVKNNDSGEWESKNSSFWDVTFFGRIANNALETFEKGDRVIVVGKSFQEKWEKDGETRYSWKVKGFDIGPSLEWAAASLARDNSGSQSRQPSFASSAPPF
jgi:single-strand DNA-binding protein